MCLIRSFLLKTHSYFVKLLYIFQIFVWQSWLSGIGPRVPGGIGKTSPAEAGLKPKPLRSPPYNPVGAPRAACGSAFLEQPVAALVDDLLRLDDGEGVGVLPAGVPLGAGAALGAEADRTK